MIATMTRTACSDCGAPLSGGRDTFGPSDAPLCASCFFDAQERVSLEIRAREIKEMENRKKVTKVSHWQGMVNEAESRISDAEDDLDYARAELRKAQEEAEGL